MATDCPLDVLPSTSAIQEAAAIIAEVGKLTKKRVTGVDAILEMKNRGYGHWRQMEWIGFYYEWLIEKELEHRIGGQTGPRFGHTTFDYKRAYVWDIKSHPTATSSGVPNNVAVLNDQEAVRKCVAACDGVGFILIHGEATYTGSADFKRWHDELKGGVSQYEISRRARGAPSRKRKTAFLPTSVEILRFAVEQDLSLAVSEGWLGSFQEGMRNSDGTPRRSKFAVKTNQIPDWARPVPVLNLR